MGLGKWFQEEVINPIKGAVGGEQVPIAEAYKPQENAFKESDEQKWYRQQLKDQYLNRGAGARPSVAESVLASQMQKSNEQMAGTIGSTRGVQNPALLARQAGRIGATQMQTAAGQGATLRAQEQQAAQGAFEDAMGRRQENLMNLEAMKANIATGQQQMAFQAANDAQNRRGTILGGLGATTATVAAAKSDINVKKNIEPATGQAKDYLDFQYRKMLDQVDPYTYDYKNEKYGRGKQLGVMAQDLEKSELGKGMVKTKDGKKEINANISTILAGQAVLNDRLNKIEGNKMQNDYLNYYQSPEYDPNAPTSGPFNLGEMNISGKLGEQRSQDVDGRTQGGGEPFNGSRPLNTMNYPTLENPPNKMPDFPLENPPSKMGGAPLANPPAKVDGELSDSDKLKEASYLMDVYNSVSNAFAPKNIGPTPQYRPTKIENFEQYRPTRRR